MTPNSKYIITSSDDNKIKLFDISKSSVVQTLNDSSEV